MENLKKYIILVADTTTILEKMVNNNIDIGYVPFGNLVNTFHNDKYVQPMILKEDENNNQVL